MANDYLIGIVKSNQWLQRDLTESKFLQDNLLGMLRNIESIIPDDCRENFYKNLLTLRICFHKDESFNLNGSTIINLNKKLNYVVEHNIHSDMGNDFEELLLMEMYHELLHLASNTIQISDDKVHGNSGFQEVTKDESGEVQFTNEFNGLTEGFTQFLTLLSFKKSLNDDTTKYDKQIEAVKLLIEKVGLETMKRAYFNNRNGMDEIKRKLEQINEKPDLYIDLENYCHLDDKVLILEEIIESQERESESGNLKR